MFAVFLIPILHSKGTKGETGKNSLKTALEMELLLNYFMRGFISLEDLIFTQHLTKDLMQQSQQLFSAKGWIFYLILLLLIG